MPVFIVLLGYFIGSIPTAYIFGRIIKGRELEDMQARIKAARQKSGGSGEPGTSIRAIDILNDISKLLPKDMDVELDRLVVAPDNVQISGDTDTFNAVDDMKSRLETSDLFIKVTTVKADRGKAGKRINFKLKIQL